jgi:hypothetical protein
MLLLSHPVNHPPSHPSPVSGLAVGPSDAAAPWPKLGCLSEVESEWPAGVHRARRRVSAFDCLKLNPSWGSCAVTGHPVGRAGGGGGQIGGVAPGPALFCRKQRVTIFMRPDLLVQWQKARNRLCARILHAKDILQLGRKTDNNLRETKEEGLALKFQLVLTFTSRAGTSSFMLGISQV